MGQAHSGPGAASPGELVGPAAEHRHGKALKPTTQQNAEAERLDRLLGTDRAAYRRGGHALDHTVGGLRNRVLDTADRLDEAVKLSRYVAPDRTRPAELPAIRKAPAPLVPNAHRAALAPLPSTLPPIAEAKRGAAASNAAGPAFGPAAPRSRFKSTRPRPPPPWQQPSALAPPSAGAPKLRSSLRRIAKGTRHTWREKIAGAERRTARIVRVVHRFMRMGGPSVRSEHRQDYLGALPPIMTDLMAEVHRDRFVGTYISLPA